MEAALSDVILLGTADQVQLAVQAANHLVAGRVLRVRKDAAAREAVVEAAGRAAVPKDWAPASAELALGRHAEPDQ